MNPNGPKDPDNSSGRSPDICPICETISPLYRPAVRPHGEVAAKEKPAPEISSVEPQPTPIDSDPAPPAASSTNVGSVDDGGSGEPCTSPSVDPNSPKAVAQHLVETGHLVENAKKHPERGLTAEELAYFDKRLGTIEQRLRMHQLLGPNTNALAYSLANLFEGNPAGFYRRLDNGKYTAVHHEVEVVDFLAHIEGWPDRGLLSIPLLSSNGNGDCNCRFGVIDLDRKNADEPPVDWPELARRAATLAPPLVVCRSKGGRGSWLFIFFKDTDGVPASDVRRLLKHYAQKLGIYVDEKNPEFFPKQVTTEGLGNGINVPYRLDLKTFATLGVAFNERGEELDLRQFIDLAFKHRTYGVLLVQHLNATDAEPRKETTVETEPPKETTIEDAVAYLENVSTELAGLKDGRQRLAAAACRWLGGVIAGGARDPRLELKIIKRRITEAIKQSPGPRWPLDRYEVIERELNAGTKVPIKIIEEIEIDVRDWPAPPGEEAFTGLVGEFTHLWEPHTEAAPVALAAQFLAFFGHAVGRGPFFAVGGDNHHTNLEVILVGRTSSGGKGQSYGCVLYTFEKVQLPLGVPIIEARGLSSGEGLIYAVRDPRSERGKVVDEGVTDKRLLVFESELASVLRRMVREGNTLSEVLRQAYDSGKLQTMTRNAPLAVTGAHISLIAHVTPADLRLYLNDVSTMNGFANRFVFLATQRARSLPNPGRPSDEALREFATRLAGVIEFGQTVKEMRRSREAEAAWEKIYDRLTAPRTGRQHNAVVARAKAHVLRLSMIYAILDGSAVIEARHQDAAVALWDYAERTSHFIFGDSLGDRVAEQILEMLKAEPDGLTTREIRAKVGQKKRVPEALRLLHDNDQVRQEPSKRGGGQCWFTK